MIDQTATTPPQQRWPWGPTGFEQRFGNNMTRIVVAIIAIPIVLGAVWLGGWTLTALAALIGTGGLLEFYRLAGAKGARPLAIVGIAIGLILVYAFHTGDPLRTAIIVCLTLPLAAIVTMTLRLFRAEGSAFLDVTATLAGVLYVSLGAAALVGLRGWSENGVNGAYLLGCVMATIWICDSAAYFVGRAFGRHKLFERVSPKKSWEGAIAGAIAAVAAMTGLGGWAMPTMPMVHLAVIGAIAGVMGQIGDLAESHMKRDVGIKDSSQIIPGHGGLLDRFDSLLFVAPMVWVYLVAVELLRG